MREEENMEDGKSAPAKEGMRLDPMLVIVGIMVTAMLVLTGCVVVQAMTAKESGQRMEAPPIIVPYVP